MMKKSIVMLLLTVPILLNCQKNESELLSLNIATQEWYTSTHTFNNNLFCDVHVKISGTTNAELLSIKTYGDGLMGCSEIKCDSGKFISDVIICFFMLNDTNSRSFTTELTAYSKKEKPAAVFCDATGSGETICKSVKSPKLSIK